MDSPTKMQYSPISLLRKSVRADMIPSMVNPDVIMVDRSSAHRPEKKGRLVVKQFLPACLDSDEEMGIDQQENPRDPEPCLFRSLLFHNQERC